jgi:DNA-binding NarL/FixJ family response regulator
VRKRLDERKTRNSKVVIDTHLYGGVSMRVLIADDHFAVRKGVRMLLEEKRYEVWGEAADGQEAAELALKLKPDLVVLDMTMPRMTGLRAVEEIRRVLPDAKIIIFSIHESKHIKELALKTGAHAYVCKNSEPADLYAAIEELGLM